MRRYVIYQQFTYVHIKQEYFFESRFLICLTNQWSNSYGGGYGLWGND
jgi:hypothetical protein